MSKAIEIWKKTNLAFAQFCDNPYNISGTANSKDYKPFVVQDGWLLGAQASQPLPVQVIADVDMVKGKTTLIRIPVTFKSVLSNDTITPNVTVYWNGTFVGHNLTTTFTYNQSKNIDFWYVPTNAGNNIPITVSVRGISANGINYTDSNSKSVDVVETRNLNLFFVPVNNPDFDVVADRNVNFLENVYPVRNGGVNDVRDSNPIDAPASNPSNGDLIRIRREILNRFFFSGESFTNAIGIVERGYLSNRQATGLNFGLGHGDIILIDESQLKTLGHEVGHTFELCDEYDSEVWDDQNTGFLGLSSNLCPNGDIDNNEVLDTSCLNNDGCPTSTFSQLYSNYGTISESTNLRNIMGGSDTPNFETNPPSDFESWISKDSFNTLLERLDSNSSFETPHINYLTYFAPYRILRIFYESNGSFNILDSYELPYGFINNVSASQGNFTIELRDTNNNIISNLSFEPNFIISTENGTSIQINQTDLIFALPTNANLSRIIFKNKTNILGEVNKTLNIPIVNLNNLTGAFSNQLINISWNSSDLDGDSLNHTVILLRQDDGINVTLGFDISQNYLLLNSSNLQDCISCKIKILATDGINTNSTISGLFSVYNDLTINELNVIYQNNTNRIFRFNINNTFSNASINNIRWVLDTGTTLINSLSSVQINLTSKEEGYIFVYYNYLVQGNYTVSATVYNDQYSERRSMRIII